jgi:hypothetical protein
VVGELVEGTGRAVVAWLVLSGRSVVELLRGPDGSPRGAAVVDVDVVVDVVEMDVVEVAVGGGSREQPASIAEEAMAATATASFMRTT